MKRITSKLGVCVVKRPVSHKDMNTLFSRTQFISSMLSQKASFLHNDYSQLPWLRHVHSYELQPLLLLLLSGACSLEPWLAGRSLTVSVRLLCPLAPRKPESKAEDDPSWLLKGFPYTSRSCALSGVNPGILTCLPRFPGLPVGPRCPASPGSPFGPISP